MARGTPGSRALRKSIVGRGLNRKMQTWHEGDCVRVERMDGKIVMDKIRACFVYTALLEPYARNERYPACVLTEHSWSPTRSLTKVKCRANRRRGRA